ncbi:MAG TPA: hypothetical protein VJ207_06630 [Thermoplasmata archaeon]|nr:hypothetical protein [Thermoplasmata archaeon]
MSHAFYAAGAIFVATYVLISARRVGLLKIDRPAAAMLGAALMIAFGVVGPLEAIGAINLEVLVPRGGRERDRRPDHEPAGL